MDTGRIQADVTLWHTVRTMARIRHATPGDLPAIRDIYNEAGIPTTATYDLEPVDLENRRTWFHTLTSAGFPVLVLEDDEVIGFAAYGPFRRQGGYRHTVEHSVYLIPRRQAGDGGTALMHALLDHARDAGVHVMVGVLDAANDGSRRFHARLGFIEAGILPQVGRKFGRWLDALIVTRTLDSGTKATGATTPQ